MAKTRWPEYAEVEQRCFHHATRADLILALALRDIGGLATGTDVVPLEKFSNLVDFMEVNSTMVVINPSGTELSNGLVWFREPGHPFMTAVCRHQVRDGGAHLGKPNVHCATGPACWFQVFESRRWDLTAVTMDHAYNRHYKDSTVTNINAWVDPGYAASWHGRPGKSPAGDEADRSKAGSAEGCSQLGRAALARYMGMKDYGWFVSDFADMFQLLHTDESARVLHIGSFDGIGSCMMLDLFFPNPESSVHAVESFLPDSTRPDLDEKSRDVFANNVQRGSREQQIRLYEGVSAEVLAWMIKEEGYWESFDFIYVEGCHRAKEVLMDAVMSWNLLKVGGVMLFDAYEWGEWLGDARKKPKLAIDAFEAAFGDRLELVLSGWRRGYRKLAG